MQAAPDHAAYYAKRKAAIPRGETVPNGGRPKRWPIPRWWRLKLEADEEVTIIRAMLAYDARCGITRPPWSPVALPPDEPARGFARGLVSGLNQFERSFILRLRVRLKTLLRITKFSQHEADGRKF
jgi:hypothetical protein